MDTGKLLICDPFYLRDWIHNRTIQERKYRNKLNEKILTYGIDFQNYTDKLDSGKSVKELIEEGVLEEIPLTRKRDFSYESITENLSEEPFLEIPFANGNPGQAISFISGEGDGEYPVFAEFIDGVLKKVWIEF